MSQTAVLQIDVLWAVALQVTLQHSKQWCCSCCAGRRSQHEDHAALAAAIPIGISIKCLGPEQHTCKDIVLVPVQSLLLDLRKLDLSGPKIYPTAICHQGGLNPNIITGVKCVRQAGMHLLQ